MMQVPYGMDGTKHKKTGHAFKKRSRLCRQSVGHDLEMVEADKVTVTNAEENKHRRTIILERTDNQSWGFTVQSYGIHHKKEDEVELLTYIDYVAHNSPAFLSGMRSGDVILSINGINMENSDHVELIDFIKNCANSMRMVVLFEDCCRKVDLHHRYLNLKRVLAQKIFEMRSLERQEMRIMSGLSRFDSFRSSRASSASSSSVFDDRRSLVPELDRCPTPKNTANMRSSLNTSLYNPDVYSSMRSLSPLPTGAALHFDFDRSSLPKRKHKSQRRLAANASVHPALDCSLSVSNSGDESSRGSPTLNKSRSSPVDLDVSPILKHSPLEGSPIEQRRSKLNESIDSTSLSVDYSLPPPRNWRSHNSSRNTPSPEKLIPFEPLELSIFKVHISGADIGESSTDIQDDVATDASGANADVARGNPCNSVDLPVFKISDASPDISESDSRQESSLKDKLTPRRGLRSSGSSPQLHTDLSPDVLFRCSTPASDPGNSCSLGELSLDSDLNYSDLPVNELENTNEEDAVSHL